MINQRIFSANVGDISTGQAGPDAIEQDIDNLLANDQELLGIVGEHETEINSLDAEKVDKLWGEEISITLQSGWTGSITCRKNDLGIVLVNFNITPGTVALNTLLGTLTTGYLPPRHIPVSFRSTNTGEIVSDGVFIHSDGRIMVSSAGVDKFTSTSYQNLVMFKVA